MKKGAFLTGALILLLALAACGTGAKDAPQASPQQTIPEETTGKEETNTLNMTIGDTPVSVAWEDNEAVSALRELCAGGPLRIAAHMYGGFEQVGDIGAALPRDDAQTTTQAGDIVLYAGDQMVVFYGSNSWAYTRLGHITDKSADELRQLLGSGDVTMTITAE